MARRLCVFSVPVVLLVLSGRQSAPQQFPPGYVDPRPILQAAAKAIGIDSLKCVTISGTGYSGMVGQQRLNDKNVDWPRGEPLANYTRTMNWETGTMKEEFDRKPGLNPASWKYGWGGSAEHRSSAIRIRYSWSMAAMPGTWMEPGARRFRRVRKTRSYGNSSCGSTLTASSKRR